MPSRARTRIPAIDGLRALAVLAVFVYHLNPAYLPGGFLGVDLFFVISGYLITLGLLEEWEGSGRIELRRFWVRRARRLAPAALTLLLTVLVATALFNRGQLSTLRGETLAALTYVTNWYLLLHKQPYFETFGAPSVLRHLWSLAVEEQFYVVWPALLALALARVRPRLILLAVVAMAVASVALLTGLHAQGVSHDRLYYGTDTRVAALLAGAALAFVCRPRPALTERRPQYEYEVLGLTSIALMATVLIGLRDEDALYQWGLPLAAVAGTGLIGVSVRADIFITRALTVLPLRWLGIRSYSVYLWHWPILVVLPSILHVPAAGLFVAIVGAALTLAAAELSYRYIETPLRTLNFATALRAYARTEGAHGFVLTAGASAATSSMALLFFVTATAREAAPPPYLTVSRISGVYSATDLPPASAPRATTAVTVATPEPAARLEPVSPLSVVATTRTPAATADDAAVAAAAPRPFSTDLVTAVGDSVMLGGAPALARALGVVDIDAEAGRTAGEVLQVLQERADDGRLGPTVVVHVGNNGPLRQQDVDGIMRVLRGARRVVLVNLHVPRPWETANNRMLSEVARQHPEVRMVDWHDASAGHEEDYFWADTIHLRPDGATIYAALIAAATAAN
jgi:peptidoglycan/LPS O-acetylase OafA/YrhL